MTVRPEQATSFLADRFGSDIEDVVRIGQGEWSTAYAYRHAGGEYVVRFGRYRDDFAKDRRAAGYRSRDLPIPVIGEIGEAFDGSYAISERAFGRHDRRSRCGVDARRPSQSLRRARCGAERRSGQFLRIRIVGQRWHRPLAELAGGAARRGDRPPHPPHTAGARACAPRPLATGRSKMPWTVSRTSSMSAPRSGI
ncbi:MAG: hypothetical protein U0031_23405 [Thermomicrobiales bacterium]